MWLLATACVASIARKRALYEPHQATSTTLCFAWLLCSFFLFFFVREGVFAGPWPWSFFGSVCVFFHIFFFGRQIERNLAVFAALVWDREAFVQTSRYVISVEPTEDVGALNFFSVAVLEEQRLLTLGSATLLMRYYQVA